MVEKISEIFFSGCRGSPPSLTSPSTCQVECTILTYTGDLNSISPNEKYESKFPDTDTTQAVEFNIIDQITDKKTLILFLMLLGPQFTEMLINFCVSLSNDDKLSKQYFRIISQIHNVEYPVWDRASPLLSDCRRKRKTEEPETLIERPALS